MAGSLHEVNSDSLSVALFLKRETDMHAKPPLFALVFVCVCGCTTENARPVSSPSPLTAEYCPDTFDLCVELCRPKGVRHFGCWSREADEEFECECLDGSSPSDKSERDSTIVHVETPRDTLEPLASPLMCRSFEPVEGLATR